MKETKSNQEHKNLILIKNLYKNQDRTILLMGRIIGLIENIMKLPKLIFYAGVTGIILGFVLASGLKLWISASPDGKLTAYIAIVTFILGFLLKDVYKRLTNIPAVAEKKELYE